MCGNADEKETIIFCKALREQKETADFFFLELTVRKKDELERDECVNYCTSSINRSIKT